MVEGQTRVVPVKAELNNPDGLLKPGMFAELNLLTGRSLPSVLAIPQSAVVETNDKKTVVFVQNGNAYQPAEVSLRQAAGDLVEIKSGLFDGDRVVVKRANQLYAQSLRGGIPNPEGEAESAATTPSSAVNKAFALPWWGWIPLGGLVTAAAFWTGMAVADRRKSVHRFSQQEDEDKTVRSDLPISETNS